MKLTSEMNFPHPVLAEWRDDFKAGSFIVDISFQEDKDKNQLILHFETSLKCDDIEKLLHDGSAQLGCFVTCISTGYRRLIEIGHPTYLFNFKPGDLLDSVVIRPIVSRQIIRHIRARPLEIGQRRARSRPIRPAMSQPQAAKALRLAPDLEIAQEHRKHLL